MKALSLEDIDRLVRAFEMDFKEDLPSLVIEVREPHLIATFTHAGHEITLTVTEWADLYHKLSDTAKELKQKPAKKC